MSTRRPVRLTWGQYGYIEELIDFDLENSDLEPDQRAQGMSARRRIQKVLDTWDANEGTEDGEE